MPLLTTRAGVAAKAYGLTNAAAAVWKALQVVGGTAAWTGFNNLSTGTSLLSGSTSSLARIMAITESGTFSYQKQSATYNSNWASIDGTGNQIVALRSTGGLPGIAKITTSGTVSWAKFVTSGGTSSSWRIATSSAGNTYIGYGYGGADHYLFKYNSSGVQQWVRGYNIAGHTLNFNAFVAIDNSENAYIANDLQNNSTSLFGTSLVKYNSSGTIQWQRFITTTTDRLIPQAMATDATGNALIAVKNRNTNTGVFLIKMGSTGTVSWSRQLTGGTQPTAQSIVSDSSDNVYISTFVGADSYIVKYNSSGTLQWQRKFTNIAQANLSLSSTNLYVTGPTASNTLTTFAMKTDGTDTGTYTISGTNYVYSVSTDLTDASYTGTNFSTSSGTDSSATIGDTSTTVTLTDSTYTISKI